MSLVQGGSGPSSHRPGVQNSPWWRAEVVRGSRHPRLSGVPQPGPNAAPGDMLRQRGVPVLPGRTCGRAEPGGQSRTPCPGLPRRRRDGRYKPTGAAGAGRRTGSVHRFGNNFDLFVPEKSQVEQSKVHGEAAVPGLVSAFREAGPHPPELHGVSNFKNLSAEFQQRLNAQRFKTRHFTLFLAFCCVRGSRLDILEVYVYKKGKVLIKRLQNLKDKAVMLCFILALKQIKRCKIYVSDKNWFIFHLKIPKTYKDKFR